MRVEAVRDFQPSGGNQLALRAGDVVEVLQTDESGWWAGRKDGDDFAGWFPRDHIQSVFDHNDRSQHGLAEQRSVWTSLQSRESVASTVTTRPSRLTGSSTKSGTGPWEPMFGGRNLAMRVASRAGNQGLASSVSPRMQVRNTTPVTRKSPSPSATKESHGTKTPIPARGSPLTTHDGRRIATPLSNRTAQKAASPLGARDARRNASPPAQASRRLTAPSVGGKKAASPCRAWNAPATSPQVRGPTSTARARCVKGSPGPKAPTQSKAAPRSLAAIANPLVRSLAEQLETLENERAVERAERSALTEKLEAERKRVDSLTKRMEIEQQEFDRRLQRQNTEVLLRVREELSDQEEKRFAQIETKQEHLERDLQCVKVERNMESQNWLEKVAERQQHLEKELQLRIEMELRHLRAQRNAQNNEHTNDVQQVTLREDVEHLASRLRKLEDAMEQQDVGAWATHSRDVAPWAKARVTPQDSLEFSYESNQNHGPGNDFAQLKVRDLVAAFEQGNVGARECELA